MNNQRRKQIKEAVELLQQAQSILETCRDEERDSFDNLPEGLQQSENGQRSEEAASTLDDATSEVESAVSNLEGIE